MSLPQRYTAKQVADALIEMRGMTFLAAKRLGCTHQTIMNYCERYPSVQAARESQRGEMVDLAELKLWQSIQNGEAWGIAFCLKTVGKHRGYAETLQHTGDENAPMVLKVIYEEAPRAIEGSTAPPALPPGTIVYEDGQNGAPHSNGTP